MRAIIRLKALLLFLVGLSVTVLGFVILFGSIGGAIPLEVGFLGVALIIIGPLTMVSGLYVYLLRKPTTQELASRPVGDDKETWNLVRLADSHTWQMRPAGLFVFFPVICGTYLLVLWCFNELGLESSDGATSVANIVAGTLILLLLAFRPIRNLVFYPPQSPRENEVGPAEQPQAKAEPLNDFSDLNKNTPDGPGIN